MPSVMDVAPRAGIEKAGRGNDRAGSSRRDFDDILKSAGNPQKPSNAPSTAAAESEKPTSEKPAEQAQTDGEPEDALEEKDAQATDEMQKANPVKKKKQKDSPETADTATAEGAIAPLALPGVAVEGAETTDDQQPEAELPQAKTMQDQQGNEANATADEGEATVEDAMMQTLQATTQQPAASQDAGNTKTGNEKAPATAKEMASAAPVSIEQAPPEPQKEKGATDQQKQPTPEVEIPAQPADKSVATVEAKPFQSHLESVGQSAVQMGTPDAAPKAASTATQSTPATPALPPERAFAVNNHDRIITGMKAEVLPTGGEMKMRLDPPEIGVLQISVKVVNGTMTASFQTDNDKATQLLSHSLGRLKESLEAQGINVEKLQVQQAPRSEANSQQAAQDQSRHNGQPGESSQQGWNQQQRRELLHRMQRRILNGDDPLDLVA